MRGLPTFLPLFSTGPTSLPIFSADARGRVRQRDRHHPEDVFEKIALSDQVEGSQRLPHATPDTEGAEAENARLLSDDVVFKSRYRHPRSRYFLCLKNINYT